MVIAIGVSIAFAVATFPVQKEVKNRRVKIAVKLLLAALILLATGMVETN